jgi:ribosomal protein S18 acetylase RimI-like enzyme
MIQPIEELSMNAWPALNSLHYDGWLLRFANGYTRRANSINPLYVSALELPEKIAYCEQLYGSRRQATVFKMTTAAQPSHLDDFLAAQGYTHDALTSVQTLNLDGVDSPRLEAVIMESGLTESWLDAYCRLNSVDQRHTATMTQMLNRILPAHCFCALKQGDQTVAVGLAVAERGYVGLFDIVTAAAYRNRGLGTQLLLNLLQWGKANHAHSAYLQVMRNNSAALNLYAKLGFREVYTYWYRVKAPSSV